MAISYPFYNHGLRALEFLCTGHLLLCGKIIICLIVLENLDHTGVLDTPS
jgi:hypothetical protein